MCDLLLSETYLEAMDGSGALKTVQKSKVARSVSSAGSV